ncbi:MAG: flagellar hook-associated protein FlgK, partial [Desulfitobacterium hafniense]|nr:flagellar hook-associated protein FlgK [Desulfitobacterium hafniense]
AGARSVVKERALTLIDTFHHISQQITDFQQDMDANVRVRIHQVNVYAEQLKDLNAQIKRGEVAGDNPNDLRVKRDAIIDELSKIVSVRVVESKDPLFTDREVNFFKVIIGNEIKEPQQVLVNDSTMYLLDEPVPDATGSFAEVNWAADPNNPNSGAAVDLGDKMGILQANIDMRGDIDGLGGYLTQLREQYDNLAKGIVDAVNFLHRLGQGLTKDAGKVGIDFFTSSDGGVVTAANISLNEVIDSDPGSIATGKIDAQINLGDTSIAAAISGLFGGWSTLKDNGFDFSGGNPVDGASFGDYYGANVAKMGVDVQQANRMKEGQDVLVTHMYNQRESYSGVSLDEEMTNLVKFQKSYSAAARMVTIMDDLLDTIVNRMGMTR